VPAAVGPSRHDPAHSRSLAVELSNSSTRSRRRDRAPVREQGYTRTTHQAYHEVILRIPAARSPVAGTAGKTSCASSTSSRDGAGDLRDDLARPTRRARRTRRSSCGRDAAVCDEVPQVRGSRRCSSSGVTTPRSARRISSSSSGTRSARAIRKHRMFTKDETVLVRRLRARIRSRSGTC